MTLIPLSDDVAVDTLAYTLTDVRDEPDDVAPDYLPEAAEMLQALNRRGVTVAGVAEDHEVGTGEDRLALASSVADRLVDDADVGELLGHLAAAGYRITRITPAGTDG